MLFDGDTRTAGRQGDLRHDAIICLISRQAVVRLNRQNRSSPYVGQRPVIVKMPVERGHKLRRDRRFANAEPPAFERDDCDYAVLHLQ